MIKFKSIVLFTLYIVVQSLLSSLANAAVEQVSDNYFSVKIENTFEITPQQLNQKLLQIGQWWHADHTYSGDSRNLSIDLKQRCFCEKLADGGFVVHLPLVFYQPGVMLRFIGGLGPLQTLPVDGVLQFHIKSLDETHTQLTVTYQVSSNSPGLKDWAEPVNRVISQQIAQLAQQVKQQ